MLRKNVNFVNKFRWPAYVDDVDRFRKREREAKIRSTKIYALNVITKERCKPPPDTETICPFLFMFYVFTNVKAEGISYFVRTYSSTFVTDRRNVIYRRNSQ